jgi:hypothetical protein
MEEMLRLLERYFMSAEPTARFRSATEFPKTIEQLAPTESGQLYAEMRECLIFTNRSRSQLIRRNEEHKQSVFKLKSDIIRLQELISQLTVEKETQLSNKQAVIAELTHEMKTMTSHLDQLSIAFEDVKDVNGAMSAMAIPGKFARFWQALKALIVWWRDEYGDDPSTVAALPPTSPKPPSEQDRRDNPQMYTDPASMQRSERDW